MTERTIQAGEFVKIVDSDDATSNDWQVQTGDKPVRVTHDKTTANRNGGVRLSREQLHTLTDLRGSSVYLSNPNDTATSIEVSRAAVRVVSQPTADVRFVENEVAATVGVSDNTTRELGKTRLNDASGVLVDPADREQFANQSGVVSFSQLASDPMAAGAVPDAADVLIQADPGNGNDVFVGEILLEPGASISLSVNDTENIPTSGDGTINVLYEA